MNKKTFDGIHTARVSYILTTKNHAEYLESALLRIKPLIKPEDELIVVDGGSEDRTHEILKKYSSMITKVISEPDLSISHGFNKGVLLAGGRYVKQLYDDDTIFPEPMEKAIEIFEKNPEIDVLVCGGVKSDGAKEKIFYVERGINYGARPEDPFRYKACGTGFVMRRGVFAKVGLFPTGWAADKVFIAQCIKRGANVRFARINLFHHPVYPHSIIKSRKTEHELDMRRAIREFCSLQFFARYAMEHALRRAGFTWAVRRVLWASNVYRREGIAGIASLPAKKLFGRKENIGKNISERYLWDGGLS